MKANAMLKTNRKNNLVGRAGRRGAVLPLLVLILPVLLILIAFLLNYSYLQLAKTELQIVADASSRAGGRTLANTGDRAQAIAVAQQLGEQNTVAGEPFTLDASDVTFGQSIRPNQASRYEFTQSSSQINSVRVNARRHDVSSDGGVGMLMPGFLGTEFVNLDATSTSTQVDLDVAIVIDRSGSMAYADQESSNTFENPSAAPPGWSFGDPVPTPSRWNDAENAVDAFLRILEQSPQRELVSLVTYSDQANRNAPLSESYGAINAAMQRIGRSFQEGSTNIGSGILEATRSLRADPSRRDFATKVLLVLTDGIHNTGLDPLVAARQARNDNALVFTITFSLEAEQTLMRRVAEIGNGKHFHADSAAQLNAAFEEIAKSLPTLLVE